jgi:hypothetical protein
MLDVANAKTSAEPVAYAVTQIITLAVNHMNEDAAIRLATSNLLCRLIIRTVRYATGAKYTTPMSDAATIPAIIAPASVLIGAANV